MRRDACTPHLAAALSILAAGCGEALVGNPYSGVDGGGADPVIDAAPATADAGAPDAALPDAAPPCAGGDAQVTGSSGNCYMLFTTPATWQAAADVCAAQSPAAHLATMTDALEDELVMELAGDLDAWVGGNDLAVGGTWVWPTGEPMIYENWGLGEPNNGNGSYEEDCMIVRKIGIQDDPTFNVDTWDDRPCSHEYRFICERP